MEYLKYLIPLIAYILGTFPSAYLIVKMASKGDILKAGTGNAGAMNSYEVTGRKEIGLVVFVLDMLKGYFAVMIALELTRNDFLWAAIAAVASVLGHNFNIWYKFKGGRGLATAAGALMQINIIGILAWGIIWLPFYYILKKEVHAGNILATILAPVAVFIIPYSFLSRFDIFVFEKGEYFYLILALGIVIMLRHIKPLRELMNKNKMF